MRGFFFTLDAIFALLLLLSVVYLFTLVSLESVSPELTQESLYSQTGDMIGMMARLKLVDIWNEKPVRDLYYGGHLNDRDLNNTILEVNGALWAVNDSGAAQNLTMAILRNMVPESIRWSFTVDNDTLYNTTSITDQSRIVTVSRRLVSGYMKSKPHIGYTARAFLSNILGRQSSQYFFFGGFVGQGNLTAVIRDIPSDANVSLIYMEMNLGSNFTLYINTNLCGVFNKTGTGNFTANAWNITYPWCLGNVSRGGLNNFELNFTNSNLSSQYIGGGYVKVVYDTAQFGDITSGKERYYFPGIDGIVNLYDSFYVPGALKNITAYMHVYNNYTTKLTVANATIYEINNTSLIYYLNESDFSGNITKAGLDYGNMSEVTIPIRLLAASNITGGTIGIADVILITDISGSMNWRVGFDDSTAGNSSCTYPSQCSSACMNYPTVKRVELAKCLDKNFTDTVLNANGNRLALVSFFNDLGNFTDLSTNKTYLNGQINNYAAGGGTCICCAVNKARGILQAQSDSTRKKFIVVMTDGIAGYRCHNVGSCHWWSGDTGPPAFFDNIYGVGFINDTRGYAVTTRTGGGRIIRWDTGTWSTLINTGSTMYGIDMYNSTLGFAVGASGAIMKWNGVAWSADVSPVGSTLRSVFIVNKTLAYAVGDTGRVLSWDGSTWFLNITMAPGTTLYKVQFNSNQTEGFIIGAGGQVYNWTYPTWTAVVSTTGQDLRDVAFVNRTDYRAYAFGLNGVIIRWNSTNWTSDTSPTANDLYTGFFVNATRGYALGQGGDIAKWNGSVWTIDYTPTGNDIYSSELVNSTLGFAVGASGRILKWTIPLWNGTGTTGYQCCQGLSSDCGNQRCESAVQNVIWSSGYASQTIQNLTIDTIGFLNASISCPNADTCLNGSAAAGNGTYYKSNNATELQFIYNQLGIGIVINATIRQEISVIGNIRTILYPDSYLEFTFDLNVPPLGYKEISITQETPPLGNCSGNFSIPAWFIPYSARVTSYSSDYWTHNVSVKSGNTGNAWKNVFNLTTYKTPYFQLGDPFNVMFPASLLANGTVNYMNVTSGIDPQNESKECPTQNKVIYRARLPGTVPFSSVLPVAVGRNVTVFYDIDGDGQADGNQTVLLGYGIAGVPFDPTPRTIDWLEANNDFETNAIADAFIRLLDYINFNNKTDEIAPPVCTGFERSGSECNPIDVELSPDVIIRISSVTEVPYMWGPIEMGVVTWIEQGG